MNLVEEECTYFKHKYFEIGKAYLNLDRRVKLMMNSSPMSSKASGEVSSKSKSNETNKGASNFNPSNPAFFADMSFEDHQAKIDVVELENINQASPTVMVKRAIRDAGLDFNRNSVTNFAEQRFSIIPH